MFELNSKQFKTLCLGDKRLIYKWVIDQVGGQDGWILAKIF